MLEAYTTWELLLASVGMLLAGKEVVSLMVARRLGLTSNWTRLATYGVIVVLLVLYSLYALHWRNLMAAPDFAAHLATSPTFDWPTLLLGVALVIGTSLFGLTAFELAALYRARLTGRTANISRAFSLGALLLLLLVLMNIRTQQWNLYLDEVEGVYLSAAGSVSRR